MMKHGVQQIANRFGYKITRLYGRDLTPALRQLIVAARPHTTTETEAIAALYDSVRHVVDARVPGAFVECGVWKGGSMLVMAHALLELEVTDRELFGFDTFTGMPAASDEDVRYDGKRGADRTAMNLDSAPSPDDVRELLRGAGYPSQRLHLVPGRVEATVPAAAPAEIAILRLDTDWYESTRHELAHLYPRLSSGGILIVDDYGHWQGARRAVDEYFAQLEQRPFLARIDYTVRLAVKP